MNKTSIDWLETENSFAWVLNPQKEIQACVFKDRYYWSLFKIATSINNVPTTTITTITITTTITSATAATITKTTTTPITTTRTANSKTNIRFSYFYNISKLRSQLEEVALWFTVEILGWQDSWQSVHWFGIRFYLMACFDGWANREDIVPAMSPIDGEKAGDLSCSPTHTIGVERRSRCVLWETCSGVAWNPTSKR